MHYPHNPIEAATHPNPYPYYAELATTKPFYYDQMLELWVASSAAIVESILQHPHCRVRPAAEPVPMALVGSAAGAIFSQLVRMNDGAGHCPFKHAVSSTLASIDQAHAAEQSRYWATQLHERYLAHGTLEQYADFVFQLPVFVVGSLLGLPEDQLPLCAAFIHDFVGCIAPHTTPEQLERGKQAAANLWGLFHSLLQTQSHGLLSRLAYEAEQVGRTSPDTIIANGIGFLSQAYEATAGLIGNTLLALGSHPKAREAVISQPDYLENAILEALRYDSPIQNTRRFLAKDTTIGGQNIHAGAVILVVLAAANHDSQANPHPAEFDLGRKQARCFSFGIGTHLCPGDALAPIIARAGVEQLIAHNAWPHPTSQAIYRQSANARVPTSFKD